MGCVLRWMRPPVQPDRAPLLVRTEVLPDRDQFLCVGLPLLPHPELQRAAIDMRRHVRLTLVLEHRHARGIPAVGILSRRLRDWKPRVVTEIGSWDPVLEVFLIAPDPVTDQVDLRRRWRGETDQAGNAQCTMLNAQRKLRHVAPVGFRVTGLRWAWCVVHVHSMKPRSRAGLSGLPGAQCVASAGSAALFSMCRRTIARDSSTSVIVIAQL